MSHYAEYLRERTSDQIIETCEGFVTFRYLNDFKTVYIVDIYVLPEERQNKVASDLANDVVELARKEGCVELIGTVMPSAKNSTTSLQVLLGYGMTLKSASENCIIMRKDI